MQTTHRQPVPDLRTVSTRPKAPSTPGFGRPINPLASLWRHKWLAMMASVLVLALGIPVAWHLGSSRYRAEAAVYVSPQFIRNLEGDQEQQLQSNSQYREFVQQQVRTINRYDIVFESFQQLGPSKALWKKPDESDRRAAERLQGALEISSVPDTYQITVALEGDEPEGLAEIVNTVVSTYLVKAKRDEFYASGPRVERLTEERERLDAQIQGKLQRRSEIAQLIGVTNFSEGYPNPYDQLLVNRKGALAEARQRTIETEAALRSAQGEAGGSALRASAQESIAKDPGLTSLKASLNQRRAQIVTRISGLADTHPGRKAAEQELRDIDAALGSSSAMLTAEQMQGMLAVRKADVDRAQQVQQRLAAEVDQEASRAQWFARHYQEALTLAAELERDRRRLNAIEDRIDQLTLEASAPGFVRSFSEARAPEVPIKGGRRKLLVLVLLASIVVGLVLPTAVDLLDPRVQSPAQVERILGFAPMGAIPITGAGTVAEARDELLRIATKLEREWRTNNTSIFVFTGATPKSGVTTIVLDLRYTLQGMGVRALAVEANAANPDARFQRTGRPTLRELIERFDTPVPERTDDWLVAVGSTDQRRLPALDRVRAIMRQLASVTDVVLVDAPPLGASADAEFLAGIADTAILVVDARDTDGATLKRAARLLEGANPESTAVIHNAVSAEVLSQAQNPLRRWLWSKP
jgi:polysaccharide biosynthesis transport protein